MKNDHYNNIIEDLQIEIRLHYLPPPPSHLFFLPTPKVIAVYFNIPGGMSGNLVSSVFLNCLVERKKEKKKKGGICIIIPIF